MVDPHFNKQGYALLGRRPVICFDNPVRARGYRTVGRKTLRRKTVGRKYHGRLDERRWDVRR